MCSENQSWKMYRRKGKQTEKQFFAQQTSLDIETTQTNIRHRGCTNVKYLSTASSGEFAGIPSGSEHVSDKYLRTKNS